MLYYSTVEYIEQSPILIVFSINVNGEFFPNFIRPTKGAPPLDILR